MPLSPNIFFLTESCNVRWPRRQRAAATSRLTGSGSSSWPVHLLTYYGHVNTDSPPRSANASESDELNWTSMPKRLSWMDRRIPAPAVWIRVARPSLDSNLSGSVARNHEQVPPWHWEGEIKKKKRNRQRTERGGYRPVQVRVRSLVVAYSSTT